MDFFLAFFLFLNEGTYGLYDLYAWSGFFLST